MEIRQLEHFIAVATEMSFSRAAHQAHVVQSALSTSVGNLEKELGVELFDRTRRQIKMTPAGELFREHARRVIHTSKLAKDAMSEYRGQLTGTVEFGSLNSSSTLNVPKILGDFHRSYPLVRVRLRQSQTGSMAYLSAIADGSLDLALVSAPDRFPTGIEMQMLCEEAMLFLCRTDHHLAQRDHVSITELAEDDLISFPPEFGLQRLVESAFTAAGVTAPTPCAEAVELSTGASLVRHGLGSMFMPASEASRFPDLRALPVQPSLQWTIFLARAGQERIRPTAAKLAELLLAAAPKT